GTARAITARRRASPPRSTPPRSPTSRCRDRSAHAQDADARALLPGCPLDRRRRLGLPAPDPVGREEDGEAQGVGRAQRAGRRARRTRTSALAPRAGRDLAERDRGPPEEEPEARPAGAHRTGRPELVAAAILPDRRGTGNR